MFRKMRVAVENYSDPPLVIRIPHEACSEKQKGKVATFEVTDFRAGTNLKSLLALPWSSGRLEG